MRAASSGVPAALVRPSRGLGRTKCREAPPMPHPGSPRHGDMHRRPWGSRRGLLALVGAVGADASELLDPLPAVLLRRDAAKGPLELWLKHADCSAPATGAEIEAVPTSKIFMTRSWGEIALVCRARGTLAIHSEYDGASRLFFKVFDAESRRLECCSGRGYRVDTAAGAGPAI